MPVLSRETAGFVPALLTASALATPLGATTELLGGGFLVGNARCADYGWRGTQQVLARMEPQGAPGNMANETQMALLLATGTISFRFDNKRRYRYTQQLGSATYVWNGPWTPETPSMTFSWNLYGDIPGPSSDTLPELIVDFDNFNEHPGCRMSAYLVMQVN